MGWGRPPRTIRAPAPKSGPWRADEGGPWGSTAGDLTAGECPVPFSPRPSDAGDGASVVSPIAQW